MLALSSLKGGKRLRRVADILALIEAAVLRYRALRALYLGTCHKRAPGRARRLKAPFHGTGLYGPWTRAILIPPGAFSALKGLRRVPDIIGPQPG